MNAMSQFELVAVLLILTAALSWVNFRLALLPHTIGLLVMGLGASLLVIGAEAGVPGLFNYENLVGLIRQVDFEGTVLDGMLVFLLFAGALQVDVVRLRGRAVTIGLMALAVPLVLIARLAAVSGPVLLIGRFRKFTGGTIAVLTWGGLRGAISVALALSLPEVAEKSALLAATYSVVLFTLIVQGLSLRSVIGRVVR